MTIIVIIPYFGIPFSYFPKALLKITNIFSQYIRAFSARKNFIIVERSLCEANSSNEARRSVSSFPGYALVVIFFFLPTNRSFYHKAFESYLYRI